MRHQPRGAYRELATQKAGVHFTTDTLYDLSQAYLADSTQYESKQTALVKEVVTIVATYASVMESLGEVNTNKHKLILE